MLASGFAGRPGPGPRHEPKYALPVGTTGFVSPMPARGSGNGAVVDVEDDDDGVVDRGLVAGGRDAVAEVDVAFEQPAVRAAIATTPTTTPTPKRAIPRATGPVGAARRLVTSCHGTARSSRAA